MEKNLLNTKDLQLEGEIWLTIPGYTNYQVSNYGRVKSLKFGKKKILKQNINSSGYFSVLLFSDNNKKFKHTHTLVGEAFLKYDINDKSYVIDHIDSDKLNNNLNNLRILSRRENGFREKNEQGLTTSTYNGVSLRPIDNMFHTQIRFNNKIHYLGYGKDEKKLSEIYEQAVYEINNGTFEQWFENHSKKSRVFN